MGDLWGLLPVKNRVDEIGIGQRILQRLGSRRRQAARGEAERLILAT